MTKKEKREKAGDPKLICGLAAMTKEGKESSLEITAKSLTRTAGDGGNPKEEKEIDQDLLRL